MIKKIFITLLFCCIIVSCGKKAHPQYKEPEKKTEIQSTHINKAK